ncbi:MULTISPECIES: hypothetical protein [unclassified Moorena]|nr:MULTISPECIES: hypothetical protein [unclassified Moorena]NEO12153.1 hypothetical protein [Moorena sp. SIO3E8]NEQ00934.1 hypothetical protein [Moorena sp. SIO3F7]
MLFYFFWEKKNEAVFGESGVGSRESGVGEMGRWGDGECGAGARGDGEI